MKNCGYEIFQYSICDGWVNNSLDGDANPYVFGTLDEAVADLQEEFDDLNAEIKAGERDTEEAWDISSFQIKCVKTGQVYSLDVIDGKFLVLMGVST